MNRHLTCGRPLLPPRPRVSPQGCPPHAYSNDDIFFLEVCVYALICRNHDELFRVQAEAWFHCEVSDAGWRQLQRYLTDHRPLRR